MSRSHQHPIGVDQATIFDCVAVVHQLPPVGDWLVGSCFPVVLRRRIDGLALSTGSPSPVPSVVMRAPCSSVAWTAEVDVPLLPSRIVVAAAACCAAQHMDGVQRAPLVERRRAGCVKRKAFEPLCHGRTKQSVEHCLLRVGGVPADWSRQHPLTTAPTCSTVDVVCETEERQETAFIIVERTSTSHRSV